MMSDPIIVKALFLIAITFPWIGITLFYLFKNHWREPDSFSSYGNKPQMKKCFIGVLTWSSMVMTFHATYFMNQTWSYVLAIAFGTLSIFPEFTQRSRWIHNIIVLTIFMSFYAQTTDHFVWLEVIPPTINNLIVPLLAFSGSLAIFLAKFKQRLFYIQCLNLIIIFTYELWKIT